MAPRGCSNHADESTALIGGNSQSFYSATTSISPNNSTFHLSCQKVPSSVDNTGSIARDLYAVERNYLSWLRLSLVFMSTGAVALDGFEQMRGHFPSEETGAGRFYYWLMDLMHRYNTGIGLFLFFLAMAISVANTAVFYHVCAQLAGSKQPLRWPGILLLGITVAVMLASLIIAIVTLAK